MAAVAVAQVEVLGVMGVEGVEGGELRLDLALWTKARESTSAKS